MKEYSQWLPLALTVAFAGWFLSTLVPPDDSTGFAFHSFGELPLVFNGRLKPMDSPAIRFWKFARSRRSTPSRGKAGTKTPKSSRRPSGSSTS